MSNDAKKAEARAYQRGYNAGRKRAKDDRLIDARRRYRNENWNRAFLTALNATVQANTWTLGDKHCSNAKDFVTVATHFADEAVKVMK